MFKVLLLFLLLTSPTHAETPREAITQVKKKKEALTLEQKRLIQEAKTIEEMIEKLSQESEENQQKLVHHEQDISKTLPLLARLERSNPLRMLVDSSTGQYRVRGMILVRSLVASLKRKMRDVQTALNELKIRTQDLGTQHETTHNLLQAIEQEKAQLLVLEKEKIKDWAKAERDRFEGNLDDNDLLEESRSTLSKERRAAALATASKGLPFRKLQPPVSGKIMKNVELQQKFSPHSQGVFFEARKNEQVCAPARGRIVFRGPFRTQAEILIIDHGDKVHTILMGMHKINADIGKNVYAGEKLGTMAGYGEGPLNLYLELRHQGKAIDSTPYFAVK
jgi:septal ring factor EnvC (AmiA/AmiB activator)